MVDLYRIRTAISSLRVKFTIIAVLITLISFGAAAFFSIRWMTEEIGEDYKEKAALMGTHIIHDLATAMIARNHAGIPEVLNLYRRYKGVEEVRVFSVKGEEKFFREKGSSEPRVEEAFKKGEPVHFHKEINKREVASFVFPLKNDPECEQCHGKSEAFRGAILLSLSQEQLKRYISDYEQKFYLLFALLALVICTATIFSVRRLFLHPLGRIQEGAEEIGKGNYHYQIPVKSKDEIGNLADTFNFMAQALLIQNRELTDQFNLVSKSQKEWQETFDCITDPIAVIDRDCHFIKANRAFQETFKENFRLTGGSVNKKCSDLFGICLGSRCPHQISLLERRPMTAEIRSPRSGKIFEISIFPYDNPQGEFIGSVAILKDVTEKKENELKMIMTERLAALGQMASGIAHEINNPLATIAVSADGLLKRVQEGRLEPQIFENYLGMIREEIHRIRKITSGMLSFVRKGGDEKKEVNIPELLEKTLDVVGLQGRLRAVEVLRQYQEDLPLILVNEGELRQVFLAVTTNALDAMEDKGRLTLEAGTEDKTVFIKIGDTGPGIPLNIMDKIFDPFFTTKAERGGTGLGLAIAYKIIQENQGTIEVTSQKEKGTSFKINLPLQSA